MLRAWRERLVDLRRDIRIRYVLLFKNHGREAGASLFHPHSQLIATPIIPTVVVQELNVAREHWAHKERCIFCDLIHQERALGDRIALETDRFVLLEPFASSFPFETWILPKDHCHDFALCPDELLLDLARLVRDFLRRIRTLLDDPPYNLILHTAPEPPPAARPAAVLVDDRVRLPLAHRVRPAHHPHRRVRVGLRLLASTRRRPRRLPASCARSTAGRTADSRLKSTAQLTEATGPERTPTERCRVDVPQPYLQPTHPSELCALLAVELSTSCVLWRLSAGGMSWPCDRAPRSEVVPFSKTGGLADVAGALPPALAELGHEVTVVAPAHRDVAERAARRARRAARSARSGCAARLYVRRAPRRAGRPPRLPALYVRPALYALPDGDFPDNAVRFAFFARAALPPLAARGASTSSTRTTGRRRSPRSCSAHDPEAARPPARRPDRAHDPQPRLPGGLPRLDARGVRLPRELFTMRPARVLRPGQLPQGRPGERRRDHDRVADLRARDPHARVRLRPRRRARQPRRRAVRNPQRARPRGVGPGRDPHLARPLRRRPTSSRARPRRARRWPQEARPRTPGDGRWSAWSRASPSRRARTCSPARSTRSSRSATTSWCSAPASGGTRSDAAARRARPPRPRHACCAASTSASPTASTPPATSS